MKDTSLSNKTTAMRNNGIQFRKALTLGVVIFVVIEALDYGLSGQLNTRAEYVRDLVYSLVYTILIYMSNVMTFRMVARLSKDRFSAVSIIGGVLASVAVSMTIVFVVRSVEAVVIRKMGYGDFLAREELGNYLLFLVITVIVTLSVYAIHLYKAYQENRVQEQKIIAGTASAQLESLKSQIDPHFLFNSLNVLSSLIEENPSMAQKFTTSLSKVYRYVLDQRNKELVSVAEELAFARTYMNLLKMRFENSISFELPDDAVHPEGKVVPLSLQLLLENAVKHNVASELRPLHIRIYAEADELVVENVLQTKDVLSERKGVGLHNIVDRYGILTDRRVRVEQTPSHFTVRIPILTQLTFSAMSENFDDDTSYYRAKKWVDELKGFYGNVISYGIVIPCLIYINLTFVPEFHWFWFPMGGWGMGLLLHAVGVFGYGARWEERKIRQLLEKEQVRTWK